MNNNLNRLNKTVFSQNLHTPFLVRDKCRHFRIILIENRTKGYQNYMLHRSTGLVN